MSKRKINEIAEKLGILHNILKVIVKAILVINRMLKSNINKSNFPQPSCYDEHVPSCKHPPAVIYFFVRGA